MCGRGCACGPGRSAGVDAGEQPEKREAAAGARLVCKTCPLSPGRPRYKAGPLVENTFPAGNKGVGPRPKVLTPN
eukprot:2447036-Prymnesium_polylepis.2